MSEASELENSAPLFPSRDKVCIAGENKHFQMGVVGHYSFISQFIALDLPDLILDRLIGNTNYDDVEDARLYSRLAHERAHFVQNVSTTYGLWKTSILRLAGGSALHSMLAFRKKTGKPIIPAFSDIVPRGVTFHDPEDPFTIATVAKTFVNWVLSIDGPNGVPAEYPHLHLPNVTMPKETTHVHCSTADGIRSVLAGKELIEFQARSAEIRCLGSTNGISQEHRDAILPFIWVDPQSQMPLRVSDRAFDARTTESWIAALALVDIALNAEWPVLGLKYLKPFLWEDLHPGWRFARMCDLIREQKIPVPANEDAVLRFQRDICGSLGWVTPLTALERTVIGFRHSELRDDLKPLLALTSKVIHSLRQNPRLLLPFDPEVSSVVYPHVYGPVAHNGQPQDWFAATRDAALQIFLHSEVLCPSCLKRVHEADCRIGKTIRSLINN